MGYKISAYIRRFLNFIISFFLVNFIISFFLVLIFIIAAAYAVFVLYDNQRIYSAAENVQADMLKLKPDREKPDFSELLSINPDVCAWLTMDGTNIDFPVLQGETNLTYINRDVYGKFALAGSIFLDSQNAKEFTDPYNLLYGHHMDGGNMFGLTYINRDVYGKFALAGSIFLDSQNAKEFTDPYNLLYGHHMDGGNMFGDLDFYKEQEFFQKNDTGTLLLPDRVYDLKVAAVLVTGVSDSYIFQPKDWMGEWQEGRLDYIRSHALFFREDVLEALEQCEEPQIIALTTCTSEFTDARTAVLAQMIPAENTDREE